MFAGKGNCNSCHVDGRSTTLKPGQTDTGDEASVQPLFTCHGFANEGLPLNPRIPLLYENRPDAFGFTLNPDGFGSIAPQPGTIVHGVLWRLSAQWDRSKRGRGL